ncbi:MAG: RNA polymerase sigma factor [Proteobacteria bacterium]|nr:RNA polymerase sigma factor [Pseudomonadota bacterium]
MPPEPAATARTLAAAAPEDELILRAARGDAPAFEALMRRHNQLVFRTARSILRSDAEAEEAVQDAWLSAWRGLDRFRAESRFSTWMVRIVRNEALGRLRRAAAEVVPLEAAMISSDRDTRAALTEAPDRTPEAELARTQARRLMEARIDRLPEVYRTVFMLRAVEEMSVEEVAAALDIPEATVRSRFFRARSILRESQAQEMDMALAGAFAFDGARCDRIVANVLARGRAEGLDSSG